MNEQTKRLMGIQLEQTPSWVRDELLLLSRRLDDLEADKDRRETYEAEQRERQ